MPCKVIRIKEIRIGTGLDIQVWTRLISIATTIQWTRTAFVLGVINDQARVYAQRTRTDFCRKELREKVGPTFSLTKSQRTRTDFLSDLLCVTIAGEAPLLDDVTPIFYRTEVSAHGPIFCRKELR